MFKRNSESKEPTRQRLFTERWAEESVEQAPNLAPVHPEAFQLDLTTEPVVHLASTGEATAGAPAPEPRLRQLTAHRQPALPRNILILGATSAIAQATSRLLAEHGATFFLAARDPYKLDAVASDLRTRGARHVTAVTVDLDDFASHAALLASAIATLGSIDLALLAHGVLGDQHAAELDPQVAESIYRTNFLSPASLITGLANYFEHQGSGCLAVISSVAGDRGRKSNYVYGASKGALTILLDGVRNRVDRLGVHVLTIKPGFVATPMTAHLPRGPLFAEPRTIGQGILRAVSRRQDTVYLPGFWRLIMFVVRAVPGRIFKNLNM